MVIAESFQFNQNTADNLNPADSVMGLFKKNDETIIIEEGATIISSQNIGHSFVLGHPTNGKLGVANGIDGQQILLGDYRETAIILQITNVNNIHKERFHFTQFKDVGSTTMTWDTTNGRLTL